MGFFGLSNRELIEDTVSSGSFIDHQVVDTDITGLNLTDKFIEGSSFSGVHASGLRIERGSLKECNFCMCDLMSSTFSHCVVKDVVFEGINFIKAHWVGVTVSNTTIRGSSLHRFSFANTTFHSCTFSDIEALLGHAENCVFINCSFEIGYGSGLNGFGDSSFVKGIFHNCRFIGYPLRGAKLTQCLFSRCAGEIGDSIETHNVAGLGHPAFWDTGSKQLSNRQTAEDLIARIKSMKPKGRHS